MLRVCTYLHVLAGNAMISWRDSYHESLSSTILRTPSSLWLRRVAVKTFPLRLSCLLSLQFPGPESPNPSFDPQNSYPFFEACSIVHSFTRENSVARLRAKLPLRNL